MDRLLTPSELATILAVKPGTIYSWLSRKVDVPPFVKIGGCLRWRESTVKAWVEAKEKARRHRNFEE
jgi:excisionase family DNA binding protein